MDIPADRFNSAISDAGLKVVMWFPENKDNETAYSQLPTLDWAKINQMQKTVNLSTLSEGDPNRDEENQVLSILHQSQHLFYEDLPSWTWSLASTAHDGRAEHAIDLIRANAEGAPVVVPADGKVVRNQKDSANSGGNPTLVIEHKTEIDGRTVYWYTKYLHMQCDEQGRVVVRNAAGQLIVLEEGTELKAGATAGYTGNEGISYGAHLHEEVIIGEDGKQLSGSEFFTVNAVDLRRLLTQREEKVNVVATSYLGTGENYTANGPRLNVEWKDEVGAWVNNSYNLIYDRGEQQGTTSGKNSYWIAWHADPAKRARVSWDEKTQKWFSSDTLVEWDPINRQWVS
jgi:murein DD-endopeptidase MepM/ murein hydrolase activator NlpD